MKVFRVRPSTRDRCHFSKRPQYLLGLATVAQQARLQKTSEFSPVEFRVPGGEGLLSLKEKAAWSSSSRQQKGSHLSELGPPKSVP